MTDDPEVAEILTDLVHLDKDPEMLDHEWKRKRGGGGCKRSRKRAKKK